MAYSLMDREYVLQAWVGLAGNYHMTIVCQAAQVLSQFLVSRMAYLCSSYVRKRPVKQMASQV